MADLVAEHARWEASDWGLAAPLTAPQSVTPATYDVRRPQRALLGEVLASCGTGNRGPVDLVYKQANLRQGEFETLVALLGPPERTVFCLRDPAGFMRSAVKKFPDVALENLQEFNFVGTIQEHERIGGEVFLYHPGVTGEDYAAFLQPLVLSPSARESVRYTGASAPDLTTDRMWEHFHRLAALAANAVGDRSAAGEP